MTSVLSSMSILNQHNKKTNLNETDETVVPDSTTTVEKSEFCPGQDILLKHKDGRYYFGTVVEVDNLREQCLVKFGDNTDNWSCFKDLVKLSTPEQEDLLCVVCKKSAPKNKLEITVCFKCGRGYHQKCHTPEIPQHCQKEDSNWMCKRCLENEPSKQRRSAELKQSKKDLKKSLANAENLTSIVAKQLPYDPDSLTWDTYHRVNLEQTYCYCGEKGDWYTQMLQCGRCRQWFHEKCIKCLKYPLYCGDRFYVFVCSICNQGREFVRRLELNWVDLVHLLLFNLTAFNSKKYYDLDTVILPYVNDNWHALQLPPKIFNTVKSERRENILSVLTNNRNRFKCGREIKKRTTIWGLRVRLPPPSPCITLSDCGIVTEEELRQRWQGNRRLQFLPYPDIKEQVVPADVHMLNVMMGTAYQDRHILSESDSPCPSPDMVAIENKKYKDAHDYSGAGCVKKSVPFPKLSLKHKKRLLSLNLRKRDKLLRRQKRKNGKDETVKRMTRLSLENKSNKNETLPLTPPNSISAPPTPPTSGSSNIGPELSTDYSEHSNSLIQAFKKEKISKTHLDDLHTPCDTSGDETSSKSTLDLIIPPPKDFEGKNNPFLAFMRGEDQIKKRRSKDSITLPLPLTAVIPGGPVVRPLKRQLSEKDICIGPNGEVKRKRLRRSRSGQLGNYGQTASKTATVVPIRPDANGDWGQRNLRQNLNSGSCMDYKRLRQRPDKSVEIEKEKKPPTPKPSPVKQEPDINLDDLKSSVHSYFGAATRISDGEKFTIKAKRYGPTGKLEYLMEWEGISNGMT